MSDTVEPAAEAVAADVAEIAKLEAEVAVLKAEEVPAVVVPPAPVPAFVRVHNGLARGIFLDVDPERVSIAAGDAAVVTVAFWAAWKAKMADSDLMPYINGTVI